MLTQQPCCIILSELFFLVVDIFYSIYIDRKTEVKI